MSGFSAKTRQIVVEREGGRCARCGALILEGGEMHHRRPRGMGGSKDPETNSVSGALHLCAMCHRVIENNRDMAYKLGWLVHAEHVPGEVPVLYRGEWMLLDDDGMLNPCPPPFDATTE